MLELREPFAGHRGEAVNLSAPFVKRPVMTAVLTLSTVLFGAMAYNELPVNDLPAVDYPVIQVNVEEQSTGELTVGAGYSSAESVIGEVTLRERNLLGKGQDLRVSTTLSTKRQQYDLSFT